MTTPATCRYKNPWHNFTCPESTEYTDSDFCIFHDRCYLKGDSYKKYTEKIAEKFHDRISKNRSKNEPLKFIGYCLPDISFQDKQFNEELNFDEATIYGTMDFTNAKFYSELDFSKAKISKSMFLGTIFSKEADFRDVEFFR